MLPNETRFKCVSRNPTLNETSDRMPMGGVVD